MGDERLTSISGMDAWASKTGKVEDMSGMFYNNDGLINTNLNQFANWNVGNVRDMSYLLYDADGITDLDALAGWRPSRVEDLSHAFESMNELTNVNGLRDWSPASSSATTSLKLAYLFAGCTKLTSIEPITGSSANIGANHWNVDKVTDFSYMLYNIADASDKMAITSIDLSQWDMRSNTYRNGNILLTNMLQLSSNAYTDAKGPQGHQLRVVHLRPQHAALQGFHQQRGPCQHPASDAFRRRVDQEHQRPGPGHFGGQLQ